MGPVSATTSIDVPRERVFEAISDLAVRPSFCDHFMRDFHLARLPASGLGAAARFRVSPPGASTWMDTSITKIAPHLIREHGRCGRSNRTEAVTTWELLEGAGGMTTVRLTFWTRPGTHADRARDLLGAGRWYHRKWSRALRRLGDLLESEGPLPRVEVAGGDRVTSAAF
jgi:uncharacterized protein YndB with AHSA1/START domain